MEKDSLRHLLTMLKSSTAERKYPNSVIRIWYTFPEEKLNNAKNIYNKWMKQYKTITNMLPNYPKPDHEGGRTVGSGRVDTTIK